MLSVNGENNSYYGRGRVFYLIIVLIILLKGMESSSIMSFVSQGVRRPQRRTILVDTDKKTLHIVPPPTLHGQMTVVQKGQRD